MSTSYCLTETGLKKIKNALEKLPDNFFKKSNKQKNKIIKNLNFSELQRHFNIQDETIKKVLECKRGVKRKTLEDLFERLAILTDTSINLEDDDYIEKKRGDKKTIADRKKSCQAIATSDQVIVLPASGIPYFIRNR